MPLRQGTDATPAAWFEVVARAHPDWTRPITRGPEGFATYAVLHHPLVDGRLYGVEGWVPEDGTLDPAVLDALTEVLARHTTTPEICRFALWDGYGGLSEHPELRRAPKVRTPQREYHLFTGPLDQAQDWGLGFTVAGEPDPINSPNLGWPDDRAWFVATEVDSEWTGVAGTQALLDDLLADPRLDVEPYDPDRHASPPGPGDLR